MSRIRWEKYAIEKAATHRGASSTIAKSGRPNNFMINTITYIISANAMDVASQPMSEWVMVRWPYLRSMGIEMNLNIRPMIDLGWSMSGMIEPMMAKRITDQWRLHWTPKMASIISVKNIPNTLWVGASI